MQEAVERFMFMISYTEELRKVMALSALCSARAVAAFLVLPATSSAKLTGMTRAGLPLWIGLFIAWGQPLKLVQDLSVMGLAAMALKETLLGFMIGYAASTVFWVAEGVGSMIDNLAGYNNVQQSNPQSSDQSTPVGNLLAELAVFAFYALGGMIGLLTVLFDSFAWWPLDRALPDAANLLEQFARLQVTAYMLAVARLASPALLTLVLIDLGFGLLTKTAEKLEPSGMAQPVKGAVTMILLSLLLAVFFNHLRDELALKDFGHQLQLFLNASVGR